jgi:hypothetical protein
MKRFIYLSCFLIFFISGCYSQTEIINYGSNKQAGHFATINGIQLYYEIYGSGEPLIMLHGNGDSIDAFKFQIPFFENITR